MGTAPRPDNRPAMPDPARVVRRSVAMLRRLGYNRQQAIGMVVLVASTVYAKMPSRDAEAQLWLVQVIQAATDRLEAPTPPHAEHTGEQHGDGSSSRSGGQAEH